MNFRSALFNVESIFSYLAAIAALAAGTYLLDLNQQGETVFEALAAGIGGYFVAKGIFIAVALRVQRETRDNIRRLVQLAALEHERASQKQAHDRGV